MDGDCRRWRGEGSEGHGASELRGSKSAQHWARVEREDRGNWICKGVNPSNIEIQSRQNGGIFRLLQNLDDKCYGTEDRRIALRWLKYV